jgi:hypothetical protein
MMLVMMMMMVIIIIIMKTMIIMIIMKPQFHNFVEKQNKCLFVKCYTYVVLLSARQYAFM